jgi:hypothetical protein
MEYQARYRTRHRANSGTTTRLPLWRSSSNNHVRRSRILSSMWAANAEVQHDATKAAQSRPNASAAVVPDCVHLDCLHGSSAAREASKGPTEMPHYWAEFVFIGRSEHYPCFSRSFHMNWDTAFHRELKRFKAKAARALAKKRREHATSIEAEPKPGTWDEALQGALLRLRRRVARMRKSDASATSVRSTPTE